MWKKYICWSNRRLFINVCLKISVKYYKTKNRWFGSVSFLCTNQNMNNFKVIAIKEVFGDNIERLNDPFRYQKLINHKSKYKAYRLTSLYLNTVNPAQAVTCI
jgi:hypothetical protein